MPCIQCLLLLSVSSLLMHAHIHTHIFMCSQRHLPRDFDALIHHNHSSMSVCHSPLLLNNMQAPFKCFISYLVILEEITLISIYLQKYLAQPSLTSLLSFHIILWVAKLNRFDTTRLCNNLQNIIAQNLWGFGSMHWHLLFSDWKGQQREPLHDLRKPKVDGRLFRVGNYLWCPLLELLVRVWISKRNLEALNSKLSYSMCY